MKFFASVGIPAPLTALVIISDFVGSLALVLGLATMLLVHLPNGFFMNGGGAPHGEG